jgi:acyl-CoA hydrolase
MSQLTYRKLVHPEDLNSANTLFGGRLMQWADEAAALYAMCQMKTQKIVTLKVSELIFKEPVRNGEFLEFFASTLKVGKTSFVVKLETFSKNITSNQSKLVFSCEMVFVSVDDHGRPIAHNIKK